MTHVPWPTLHRFVPRSAADTTGYGYELLSARETLEDVLVAIEWIDCWCPDAAEFVLVGVPEGLSGAAQLRVRRAIDASPFKAKLRAACRPTAPRRSAASTLLNLGIGLVLDGPVDCSLEEASRMGFVALRLNTGLTDAGSAFHLGASSGLLREARDNGLRTIASQVPRHLKVQMLLDSGFDYVSQAGLGLGPKDVGRWLRERVAK